MKNVAYSPTHVEKLIQTKDVWGLLTLIEIRTRALPIPNECRLFSELMLWMGSCRSGVWQYYEDRTLGDEQIRSVSALLREFGFHDVIEVYTSGVRFWHESPRDLHRFDSIDTWISENEEALIDRGITTLCRAENFLKNNEGA